MSDDFQEFAWNSSCLANDKDENEWLELAKIFMRSSSREEYEIQKDLMSIEDFDVKRNSNSDQRQKDNL